MKLGLPEGPDTTGRIIKICILAVGGQGGGVLSGWVTDVAQRAGWHVQSTSVAGVAQRTGATIYYVEMMPRDPARPHDEPVLSLSPSPGDVDILIAAELAEAGRAVLRGFVTPERTTLIASSHRMLAVSEKIVPGDGRADSDTVIRRAGEAARRFIHFDMETMAKKAGSVVSASLFGALAGSGELPFSREAFEATVGAGGKGAQASLAAFALAYDRAAGTTGDGEAAVKPAGARATVIPQRLAQGWQALLGRAAALPEPVREMAEPGLRKTVDFLDLAYGDEYLAQIERLVAADNAGQDFAFSREAAKYLANAMVYDDIVRVADLKTRAGRADRVRAEVKLADSQTLATTEYFHPRMEEIVGLMPAGLGAAIEARPGLMKTLNRFVDRGRRIRTDTIHGFGMLWVIGGLRHFRRSLLRHKVEAAHTKEWLALAEAERARDYALGVEVLKCRRLMKGYSDTHARGQSKFDHVLACLPLLRGRQDAADWLRRLREAALADAEGKMLDGAIKTVHSFTDGPAQNAG
ncbi:indolepyruvate oxidoreductase subunit beta family protein [Ollibium composti]|uniref:Indolepyruvate oxidoreductase subunit beta family protein n=1 Tax=Ollibium composti TaxID=2675109 RepID=A0ABY2Q610_9HYPH|nr:indolepyruvate oxidoreductase subunit beta family protein [Mesorhizobium composti]THF56970.1 indolepyruvate oxidoreductase subunit beta family protein [Mesorhizobium composti]